MKRIIMLLTVAALMVTALTVTSAGAFAASPSERECDAQGGTFDRQQGQVSCVTTETESGKNENQPKFQKTTTTTDTGQGNINNKEDTDSVETCGKPCPPGQFK
jgi:hypothetical protein